MEAQTKKHVIIVAGEASGDMHAAELVREIKGLNPNISFSGVGGQQMKDSGVEIYADLTKLAVVGFVEVLKHYTEIKRIFDLILVKAVATKADAVILVDYPGFNLRLAREFKKLNMKVIYYISPQVWAWKASRIKLIKEVVDKMLVLFPFEKEFYAKYGMETFCVGHPLLDIIKVTSPAEIFLKMIGLPLDKLTIALLPGSRQKEVEVHLPIMIKTAKILVKEFDKLQFIVIKAPTTDIRILEKYLAGVNLPIKIVYEQTYNGINAANICLVASGTATLEVAILEKPMVVIYKISLITWLMALILVKISYIGLVNVVAGKKIVPECIQFDANPERIAEELKSIFRNEVRIAEIKLELKKVRESLGEMGASRRAAQEVMKELS